MAGVAPLPGQLDPLDGDREVLAGRLVWRPLDLARAITLDALGETERAVATIARGLRATRVGVDP